MNPENVIVLVQAIEKGWNFSYDQKKGFTFEKGNTVIWQCKRGWQCADLVDGYYTNHRGLIEYNDALLFKLLGEN